MKNTDRNLREYDEAIENAYQGLGTVVSVDQLKELLTEYVDKDYGELKTTSDSMRPEYYEKVFIQGEMQVVDASNEFEYHAIGGGFAVKHDDKLYIMPLYDKKGENIHVPLINKIDIERYKLLANNEDPKTYKEYKYLLGKLKNKGYVNSTLVLTDKGKYALEEYDRNKQDLKIPFMFASDKIFRDYNTGQPLPNQDTYKGNVTIVPHENTGSGSCIMYTEIDPETKERSWNPPKIINWELANDNNKTFSYDSELNNKPDVYKYFAGPLKDKDREHRDSWETIKSTTTPTQHTHGDKYAYAIGPFKCKKDAEFYIDNTLFNSPTPILPNKVAKMRKEAKVNKNNSKGNER